MTFKKIAVIGAGTMGSGIAGQIANAGQKVLLLDLPQEDNPNGAAQAAINRLLKSDPPALMDKHRADLIEAGNIRDDLACLKDYDLVIEAIVERLDIKKALYQKLDNIVDADCIITSNTSTIPIRLLVEDMNASFKKRFAITHYFNPVRYMRLLELVAGEMTDRDVIDRLAHYNDSILGKGVVICRDTPGFLGNRVGVFALQVGMDEAFKHGLNIEVADSLMGRPMGIPKTGIFGLYDLIGVDLMADVVKTLGTILPQNDVFHAVGEAGPLHHLITSMINDGYTGDKGKGGFYRQSEDGKELALDLASGDMRQRQETLTPKAQRAAMTLAEGGEALEDLLNNADASEASETLFCRHVLARVLAYAASLIPDVTISPQDIDDAMKLGFNWVRGPFELMDAIGNERLKEMIKEAGIAVPSILNQAEKFYKVKDDALNVRRFENDKGILSPVILPEDTIRFHLTKQCLKPLYRNQSASLYRLDDDLRLVEFHSKANALTASSMEVIQAATEDPGNGIIIHNDAQHFSAGVDLNGFLALIHDKNWQGIDEFLIQFQKAVKSLRDAPVPVIAAPSGLTLGGGYEVIAHADKVIAHSNSVMGLVEASVGVVPGGGGVKETFARWLHATGNPKKAAWKTWMQIGYARTGTSPEESAKLMYFLPERDASIMNRDKLLAMAMRDALQMQKAGYTPQKPPQFTLPAASLLDEMSDFMDEGIAKGMFFPHDKTVAMAVATIVVNDHDEVTLASEQDLFDRERRAFLSLAKTDETEARITAMLGKGIMLRN